MYSTNVFSQTANFIGAQSQITFNSESVGSKLEDTILTVNGFLKKYNPIGAEIKNKQIDGNTFDFVIIKRVLGFAKLINIKGSVNFERANSGCLPDESAYSGSIDFTGSDSAVTNNVESCILLLCSSENSDNSVTARLTGKIYYKGPKYGWLLEQFATSAARDQVNSILNSMKDDVLSK